MYLEKLQVVLTAVGLWSVTLVCGSNPRWCLLQIEALKLFTQDELVSWFLEHRNTNSRKLSVHVSYTMTFFINLFRVHSFANYLMTFFDHF